jgi:hypothetical protein
MRWWLFFLLLPGILPALDVKESRWGYTGTVVRDSFNPLTLVLVNDKGTPYDGVVEVQKTGYFEGDEILRQELYLAPGGTRVVQFHVWMPEGREVAVMWKGGRFVVPEPKVAQLSVVHVAPESGLSLAATKFRMFPAEWFPTASAALDGLGAVIMDSVPRWEESRRRALLEWLQAGGVVHLATGLDGKRPVFEAELAVLNEQSADFRVGEGRVSFHDTSLSEVDKPDEFLKSAPPRALVLPKDNEQDMSYQKPFHEVERSIFQNLAEITRPNINWGLINFLGLLYILILGPGLLLLGRKTSYPFLPLLLFFVSVGLFSWFFSLVGKRGFGEQTQLHSLAVARQVGPGSWDVTQYANLFVTDGGPYEVRYASETGAFSTGSRREADTLAVFTPGPGGKMQVEMPLFSRRPFLHRGRFKGPVISTTVHEWTKDSGSFIPRISIAGLADEDLIRVSVRRDRKRYDLEKNADGEWVLPASSGPVESEVSQEEFDPYYNSYPYYRQSRTESRGERMEKVYDKEVNRLFELATPESVARPWPVMEPKEGAPPRLVIMTRLPADFRPQGDFANQTQGRAALVIPLEIPAAAAPGGL